MATTVTLRQVNKVFYPHGVITPQSPKASGMAQSRESRGPTGWLHRLIHDPERNKPVAPQDPVEYEGGVWALHDVTLTVRPGEILGVLGPSGCGKSTLLRVIAGLIEPDSGTVAYDGESLYNIEIRDRGIGMVFQEYALYPHLPSEENIGFFLRLRQREQEIPERVREISALMDIRLEPLLRRKPPTLSGGEKQRVAIARCLARDPRVFLFDEPFSNLDAAFRLSARAELKRLLRRYEVTSVYVTHDQSEAIALADRIAVMRQGRLEQIGTYQHLYQTPKNIFVAGFLGSPAMNLYEGIVQDGHWVGPAFTWGPIRGDLPDGTRLVLGVRPEHLLWDDDGPIIAKAELVEPLFGQRVQLVYTHVGPHRTVARLPIKPTFRPGDKLRLTIAPEQVHLFDLQNGLRIG